MTVFLNAVGQVFNFAIGCVGDVGGLFTAVNSDGALENPLLLASAPCRCAVSASASSRG